MFISYSLYLIIHIGKIKTFETKFNIESVRSYDGFIQHPSGIFQALDSSSSYISQQKMFDDLGREILKNAFDG